ncbi:MAG: AraC family transcriptional regulator [Pleurocapsa sp. MO_192.B19]|nr:AraC family transcriptional regulator [Pleurocapsa sp. MO_192.B19]
MKFFQEEIKVYRGKYPPPPDRLTYPSVPVHQIMLNVGGSSVLEGRLDGGRLQTGFSAPGIFTFVRANQTQEWLWNHYAELLMLEFSPKLLDKIAAEGFELTPEKVELLDRFTINAPLLQQIVLAIDDESKESASLNRLYFESLQNTFLLHLLRHHCNLKIINPNLSSGLTQLQRREIIDYINSNLAQNLGLAELATIIRVSPPHFGRLFKQSMGVSPYQYVLKCRIQRAKKLLAEGKITLGQIAQTLGFYDQSHFSRVFRKAVGVTPRQYQKDL